MRVNVYQLVKDDAGVRAVLGDDPMRLYPVGEADEAASTGPAYATWQIVAGRTEDFLAGRPNLDWFRVQIDVWGKRLEDVDAAADALRTGLELRGHLVSINPEGRDPETRLYRIGFDFEFWQGR